MAWNEYRSITEHDTAPNVNWKKRFNLTETYSCGILSFLLTSALICVHVSLSLLCCFFLYLSSREHLLIFCFTLVQKPPKQNKPPPKQNKTPQNKTKNLPEVSFLAYED